MCGEKCAMFCERRKGNLRKTKEIEKFQALDKFWRNLKVDRLKRVLRNIHVLNECNEWNIKEMFNRAL